MKLSLPSTLKFPQWKLPNVSIESAWNILLVVLAVLVILIVAFDAYVFFTFGIGWNRDVSPNITMPIELSVGELDRILANVEARANGASQIGTTTISINPFLPLPSSEEITTP